VPHRFGKTTFLREWMSQDNAERGNEPAFCYVSIRGAQGIDADAFDDEVPDRLLSQISANSNSTNK